MQMADLKISYFFLQNTILMARASPPGVTLTGAKIQQNLECTKKKECRCTPEIKKIIL